MMNRRTAILTGVAVCTPSTPAFSQGGRNANRMLVGFPPGGTADVLARALVPKLAAKDTPQFIVDNKPGAGGRLAVTEMVNSTADGTTVLMTADPILVIYPHVFRKLAYKTETDVIPVAPVAAEALALVVGPMVPPTVTTLAHFVDWCKKNRKDAAYATAGAGTTMHFVGAMLARTERFDLLHIPHRGAAAAMQDVIGGQIASTMAPLSQAIPYIGSGKIRVLAASGSSRSRRAPDVPTFTELGLKNIQAIVYYGTYLRTGTPEPLVQKMHAAVTAAASSPEFTSTLDKLGLDAYTMSQKAFTALVKADLKRWGPIVKATGYNVEE